MLGLDCLDEQINEYYDEELNECDLISFEARMAKSEYVKNYIEEKSFDFLKISNSIKITKIRMKHHAQKIADSFINNKKDSLTVKLYPICFKGFNKTLSSFLLNIHRDNS